MKITDCHVHAYNPSDLLKIKSMVNTGYFENINMLSITAYSNEYLTNNILSLAMKLLCPSKVYSFGGLYYKDKGPGDSSYFLPHTKRLMSMGFDGMKMIESKPNVRKRLSIGLDDASYDDFYDYLSKNKIPLLMHVNDPEDFWHKDRAPSFAFQYGFFYGDGTFLSKEEMYDEIFHILNKFSINIIFAHFYFMSEDINRTLKILDTYKNVYFDITPGTEMYKDFSNNKDWKDFFIKYAHRILFGTDNFQDEWRIKPDTVKRFMETSDTFSGFDMNLRGLDLERECLNKIFNDNFKKLVGDAPKAVNIELFKEEFEIVRKLAESSSYRDLILNQLIEIKEIINNNTIYRV